MHPAARWEARDNLAKVGVEGSNPFARSRFLGNLMLPRLLKVTHR